VLYVAAVRDGFPHTTLTGFRLAPAHRRAGAWAREGMVPRVKDGSESPDNNRRF
jgi:hypothetical protein